MGLNPKSNTQGFPEMHVGSTFFSTRPDDEARNTGITAPNTRFKKGIDVIRKSRNFWTTKDAPGKRFSVMEVLIDKGVC